MKKLVILVAVLFRTVIFFAQDKTTLVVEIVIDDLRYDLIEKYYDKFGELGFKKLIKRGIFCKNAHYNYINVNSASGFATIACGAYPSEHGIINNTWYNRLKNREIYCIRDDNYNTVGASRTKHFSPANIKAISWTDQLRLAYFKMSKVFAVSFDDYAAVLSAGKLGNAAFWFDQQSGNWVTTSYYLKKLPQWVTTFNIKNFGQLYLQRLWITSYNIDQYRESLPDATQYEMGFNGKHTFPYDLSLLKKDYKDYTLLKYTPFANTFTKDFAISLMINEHLGRDLYPDALIVNFAATKYIGDLFGTHSVELEDAYIKLDKDLSHFISAVEDYVGKDNVLFVLTSDKGACENRQWLTDINITADNFNPIRASVILNSYLRAIYGMANWVKDFYNFEFYLDHNEIDKQKLSLKELQEKATSLLVNMDGVNTVIPTYMLKNGTYSSGVMKQAQNSYFEGRSGDLYMVLDYGWRFKTHKKSLVFCCSPYNENTHVPIIFYGKGIKHTVVYDYVSMDDLAVTLSFLLNIPLPNKATGNPVGAVVNNID